METSAKTATNVNDIFYEIGMTFYCVVLEFISQITQRLKLKYESTLLSWSFGVCTCIEQLLLLLLFFWCLLVVPNGVGLLTITDVFLMTKLYNMLSPVMNLRVSVHTFLL